MTNLPIEEIKDIIINKNTKDIKKEITSLFLSKGLDRSKVTGLFADRIEFNQLTINEKICFIQGLYNTTNDIIFDKKEYFTQEEIDNYLNLIDEGNFEPEEDKDNERVAQKLDFIHSCYGVYKTQKLYYFYYEKHIKPTEDNYKEYEYNEEGKITKIKNVPKDLCNFTALEITELMQSVIGSILTKNSVLSFITKYLNWCHMNGIIEYNPMLEIKNTKELIVIDKKELANSYVSVDELYKEVLGMAIDDSNSIGSAESAIVMLIRNGIYAEEVTRMKYSDVNFENRTVIIREGDIPRIVELTPMTVKLLKEYRDDNEPLKRNKKEMKIIEDHVVKLYDTVYSQTKAMASIRKMLSKFKEFGYKPLNENILLMSYKIDLLDKIKKQNGELTIQDYKNIQVQFGKSENNYFKLKTEYENIRQVKRIK